MSESLTFKNFNPTGDADVAAIQNAFDCTCVPARARVLRA